MRRLTTNRWIRLPAGTSRVRLTRGGRLEAEVRGKRDRANPGYVRVSGPLYTRKAAETRLAKLKADRLYSQARRDSFYIELVGAGTFWIVRPSEKKNPEVTDRALRYRANRRPPPGEKRCAFCGSRNQIMVGHLDGHEENASPDNLIWTCRSCNGKMGHHFKRRGLGRRTRQYNPASDGAQTVGQWVLAVQSMKGESDAMTVPAAVELIRATPPTRRSTFTRTIWSRRRARGTDRLVPF